MSESEDKAKEVLTQMKTNRLRIMGGELSDPEQTELDDISLQVCLAIVKSNTGNIELTMQALAETIYSALVYRANTSEDFMKNVYTFVNSYFIPQAEKIKDLILEKKDLDKQTPLSNRLEKLLDNVKNSTGEGMIISGGSIEQVLDKLRQITGDPNDCNCPICTKQREEQAALNPNPKTKH